MDRRLLLIYYLANRITQNEFEQFWPGDASVRWVSRYTYGDEYVGSDVDPETGVWTLTFGEGEASVTFTLESVEDGNAILVDGPGRWSRLDERPR